MATIQLKPKINHLNFVHSYLIKTKDVPASEIKIKVEKDTTAMQVGKLNYNLLEFPKNHIPYFNTAKDSGDVVINILAIPKELTAWGEKND